MNATSNQQLESHVDAQASTHYVPQLPFQLFNGLKCENSSSPASPTLQPSVSFANSVPNEFLTKVLMDAWKATSQELTPERMLEYIVNAEKYDCTLQIFHARVAQKSYGNEKRFISPPPCVYMLGPGWAILRQRYFELLIATNPNLAAEIARLPADRRQINPRVQIGIQTMRDEWLNTAGLPNDRPSTPPTSPWVHEPFTLDFTKEEYCAAKSVYISDSEKLKYFKLAVKMNIDAFDIGCFPSERIKVISKPSKKKQSMKNTDCNYLCITSGKKVALFNRLRSQTVSTRYLHVENDIFHASGKQWGAFTIHLVDVEKSPVDDTNFHTKNGFIKYGSTIKLVDSCTGIALPRLVVRKVDRNLVLLEGDKDEPVSQLHKCAFQFCENSTMYLSLAHDNIAQCTAKVIDPTKHEVNDGAAWTIISTEKVEYRFFQAMGPTAEPITPIPVVEDLTFTTAFAHPNFQPNCELTLMLSGDNFSTSMTAWFGAYRCQTTFRSPKAIECEVPSFGDVLAANPWIYELQLDEDNAVEVPIYIVRSDGVVYTSHISFTYQKVREIMEKVARSPNFQS